jgi:hypothetical protein
VTIASDSPFFDILGLPNVVWFDDLFDSKSRASTIDVAEQVGAALEAGIPISHPKLDDLTAEDTAQEWARRIEERLDLAEKAEMLGSLAVALEEGSQLDYSAGELEQVALGLGARVQRFGLTKWQEVKEGLISSSATEVYLVDREGIVDGARSNVGDEIVRELVGRCPEHVLVLVLTHSVGPDGVDSLRKELADELGIASERLGVVSKRPGDGSLVEGVKAAVRIVLTQLTCMAVTSRIVQVMRSALDSTQAALRELPVHALDIAVFENPFSEGASEIDVLSRILTSRQRTEVSANIAGSLDDVHSPLARMRKLRLLGTMPALPSGDAGLLFQWRRDEVFEAADRLNPLFAPLACGDVFQRGTTNNYFVLLGQPCDLMVRPGGERAADEGMFVKLRCPYEPQAASEGRFFEVPALHGSDRWALDFRSWTSVSLDCLEWTSFNKEGRVAFVAGTDAPAGLLPGCEKRFERARNKFRAGRAYCLSLGELSSKVKVASAAGVEFPYRRVARLLGSRAGGAFAAFASYHARGAFDHDYTKGLEARGVS